MAQFHSYWNILEDLFVRWKNDDNKKQYILGKMSHKFSFNPCPTLTSARKKAQREIILITGDNIFVIEEKACFHFSV